MTIREALEGAEKDLESALARVREALGTLPAPSPAPTPAPAPLIVLDAGHGGHDNGASVQGAGGVALHEKNIVMPFVNSAAGVLSDAGYRVMRTRTDDTFIPLGERARMANEAGATCFVSIHANAAGSGRANGAWVLYDDATKDEDGKALATAVFERLRQIPGLEDADEDAEVYPDDSPWVGGRQLAVLSQTRMPAILIELGFLTNVEDLAELLNTETHRQVAWAIRDGITVWMEGRRST